MYYLGFLVDGSSPISFRSYSILKNTSIFFTHCLTMSLQYISGVKEKGGIRVLNAAKALESIRMRTKQVFVCALGMVTCP